MRTNTMKRLVRVFAALLLCVAGLPLRAGADEPTAEELQWAAELTERLFTAQHGQIILAGEVVNAAGLPLDGVLLEIVKAKRKGWEGTKYEFENRIVNGSFRVELSGYAAVRLNFEKDGHQTKVLEFSMPLPEEEVLRALGGYQVGPFTFQKDDIRVEMLQAAESAELAEYNEVLEYAVSGEAVVIDFDELPGSAVVRVNNVADPSQLPANSVYMIADQAAGQIAVTALPRPDSDLVDIVPTRLTLRMRDASGGFVRFVPEPGSDGFTQMTSAPISGYQNALMLEAQDFPGGGQRHGVLFYFKNKDNYGKGWAGAVRVNDGRSEVRLVTAFEVQTDGSRHLDTGPDPVVNTVTLEGPIDTGDSVPPQISCPSDVTAACAGLEGSEVTFAAPTAVDETDPNPRVVLSHESSSRFPVGTTTVTATAFDAHGNSASCTFTVTVPPPKLSWLAPIKPAIENVVKVGQTIPVKVAVECSGLVLSDLKPEIRLVAGNFTDANPNIEQEIVQESTSKTDTTGIMRWSDADGHYIYNLSTKGLKTGQNYTVLVRLRNQAGAVVSEVRALLLMKK